LLSFVNRLCERGHASYVANLEGRQLPGWRLERSDF
jgi:hypothetical protein